MPFIAVLLSGTILTACGQQTRMQAINGLSIDPSIVKEVEKYIQPLQEYADMDTGIPIYNNSVAIQYYENDSLLVDADFDTPKTLFKSFYLWLNDTLVIDGAFGLFGGAGFDIRIAHNKATLYHMLSSDDIPAYAYGKNDKLQFRLEVPCTDTRIVLSEIPDSTKQQVVYGYVAFKSADYYSSSGFDEGRETGPRKKVRTNMKRYFKSGYLRL